MRPPVFNNKNFLIAHNEIMNNNNNNDNEQFNTLDSICWGLFERTGHIGYYFLYNEATKKREEEKDKKD